MYRIYREAYRRLIRTPCLAIGVFCGPLYIQPGIKEADDNYLLS